MIAYVKRNIKGIIVGVLILVSLWGMVFFHHLTEVSSLAIYASYFLVFQALFILSITYVVVAIVIRLLKRYGANIIGFVRQNVKGIVVGVFIFISLWGMLVFKRILEFNPSNTYEFYFFTFQMLFILTMTYLVLSWIFRLWKQYRQLKNDKTDAELALLKSKMDPHFFFNTLNNLYGLAVEKSESTPEVILKLSDIMRYTIYEGEKENVTIADEITYLEQYIEIHRIRYQKTVTISFDKTLDHYNYTIPPLLLVILVENGFKHGIETLVDDAFMHIKLTIKANKFSFIVTNNFDTVTAENSGIGLKNLKKRLQLLYPKRHELILSSKQNQFVAQLNMKLK